LASRTSAYLLTADGEAACFSGFAWAFGSNSAIGVVLIFLLLDWAKWVDFQIYFSCGPAAIDKPPFGSIRTLKRENCSIVNVISLAC